jgi:cytochrome c oxidase cbb3-type subunit 1
VVRLAGGVLYLGGMLIMCWNVWKTVVGSQPVDAPVPAPAMAHA